jgi:hypothetical protein
MAKGQKTGGRHRGTPNRRRPNSRRPRRRYTREALRELATIMRSGQSEPARIAAAKELLDRGHGKGPQALTNADGGPLVPATVIHEHILGPH